MVAPWLAPIIRAAALQQLKSCFRSALGYKAFGGSCRQKSRQAAAKKAHSSPNLQLNRLSCLLRSAFLLIASYSVLPAAILVSLATGSPPLAVSLRACAAAAHCA